MKKFIKILHSNYFLLPVFLIEVLLLLSFVIFGVGNTFIWIKSKDSTFWESVILAVTFIAIAVESSATKKSVEYLEYSSRPTGYFLLFRSLLYIKNTSKFSHGFLRDRLL